MTSIELFEPSAPGATAHGTVLSCIIKVRRVQQGVPTEADLRNLSSNARAVCAWD